MSDGYVLPPPPQVSRGGIWRQDKKLVMARDATLPNRCVKCNVPTPRRVKRTLTWHHPALFLLAPASPVIYLIVAMIIRETAKIEIGLCEDHHASWRRKIWITTVLVIGGLISFVAAIVLQDWMLALVGAILLLGALVFGIQAARLVLPTKIDKQFIWLTKVNQEYLESFPQLPH